MPGLGRGEYSNRTLRGAWRIVIVVLLHLENSCCVPLLLFIRHLSDLFPHDDDIVGQENFVPLLYQGEIEPAGVLSLDPFLRRLRRLRRCGLLLGF